MKRVLCTILALVIALSLVACGGISQQDQQILNQRRDQAESYMREMATVLWRTEEDIIYSFSSKITDPMNATDPTYLVHIKAGRLYRGLPYSHAAGDSASFLEYAGEPDDKGIYTVSGLGWEPLNGGNTSARVGNDCAAAIGLAWNSLGNSLVRNSTTKYMTEEYGYLRVGEYKSDSKEHTYTAPICELNGTEVMFAAYAQLQKADGVVRRNKADNNGHSMMIVSVNVVKNSNGEIDGTRSYVTVLAQTSGYIKQGHSTYDETMGENVYTTYLIDEKYSFVSLYSQGYLPITCKELIDPSPVVEPSVSDSVTDPSFQTLLDGKLKAIRFISAVSVAITDSEGNVVQKCSASPVSRDLYDFDMQTFATDKPEVLRGSINPEALTAGTYHCKVICRLANGQEFTVRDFDFTV